MWKRIISALALLSLFLLCITIYGSVTDPYLPYKHKYQLASPEITLQEMDRDFAQGGLSDRFVGEFISHFRTSVNYEWPTDAEYMPIQENWVLYVLRLADPFIARYVLNDPATRIFGNVELPTYRRAMYRGFGICSQLSMAGADLLHSRYGINAHVAGLNGHVVIQILSSQGGEWVVDPSFKVYAKGNVLEPEKLPEEFFAGNNKIKSLYFDKKTNFISRRAGWGGYSYRSSAKQEMLFYFVMYSYYLKWLLPLTGLAAYLVVRMRSRKPHHMAIQSRQDGTFGLASPVVD